jgi:hypothetical protein
MSAERIGDVVGQLIEAQGELSRGRGEALWIAVRTRPVGAGARSLSAHVAAWSPTATPPRVLNH